MIELEDLEQPKVPKVISIAEVRKMVTQLILFTKAHSLFSEELNLLSLNVTLKNFYNYALKQSKIHRVLDFGLKVRDSS
jgi:hypothetical protein